MDSILCSLLIKIPFRKKVGNRNMLINIYASFFRRNWMNQQNFSACFAKVNELYELISCRKTLFREADSTRTTKRQKEPNLSKQSALREGKGWESDFKKFNICGWFSSTANQHKKLSTSQYHGMVKEITTNNGKLPQLVELLFYTLVPYGTFKVNVYIQAKQSTVEQLIS